MHIHVFGFADWFKAVQALITIGLILLIVGALTIILYMFLHSANVSKNALIITFAVLTFIAGMYVCTDRECESNEFVNFSVLFSKTRCISLPFAVH